MAQPKVLVTSVSGLRAVDLVSRDASAAGRGAIARCLTAQGSPLFSKISLNQQPPCPASRKVKADFLHFLGQGGQAAALIHSDCV